MLMPLFEIGFDNFIFPSQLLIVLYPETKPIKKMVSEADENNKLFDVTKGRKTRSVIALKTGDIVSSNKTTDNIKDHYQKYIDKVNSSNTKGLHIDPLLHVGYKNYVPINNISLILNPNTQPAERLIKNSRKNNMCFDIKRGKKTKSVIVLTTGHIVLSVLDSKTLKKRYMDYLNSLYNGTSDDKKHEIVKDNMNSTANNANE